MRSQPMRWIVIGCTVGFVSWAAFAAVAWTRYGKPRCGKPKRPATPDAVDPLLDRFMPEYEASERHWARVAAPAGITFAVECTVDLRKSILIRAISRGRELMLGSAPAKRVLPRTMLDWAKELGWRELAQAPGREVVFGAVTKPWEANVVFVSRCPVSSSSSAYTRQVSPC